MWIAVFLAGSCVTKSNYELVEVQLDATRTALSAQTASAYQEIADREARIAEMDARHARLQDEYDLLTEHHDQMFQEIRTLRADLAAIAAGEELGLGVTAEHIQAALDAAARAEFAAQHRESRHQVWRDRFAVLEAAGKVEVVFFDEHTVIRVPTKMIFNEGRVSVSPRGEVLLDDLIVGLSGAPDLSIRITAHTDDRPYHTAQYDSSWQLGFAQAMTVVHELEQSSLDIHLTAASAAGNEPIADNSTAEGREKNHRLELTLRQLEPELPEPPEEAPPE